MKTFEYMGYHFTPSRKLPQSMTFEQIMSKTARSDIDLYNSNQGKGGKDWDYDEFYSASGNSDADLFVCQENGKTYIPCLNELFLYKQKI